MKVLQLVAHPAHSGATISFAEQFAAGATSAGHLVKSYNIFHTVLSQRGLESLITDTDHLNFAWPCWWEMPPSKLVDLFQTTFTKGFAFDFVNGQRKTFLNQKVSCLISMGQLKEPHTKYLAEAMEYCGLKPQFFIFQGIGPGLPAQKMQDYLTWSYNLGKSI